ncbi:MAG: hypothetical protein KBS85_05955 [Lachnospiraceae bacterium]|nr:hypothetical protein [Candidatus Merdinaster equi]
MKFEVFAISLGLTLVIEMAFAGIFGRLLFNSAAGSGADSDSDSDSDSDPNNGISRTDKMPGKTRWGGAKKHLLRIILILLVNVLTNPVAVYINALCRIYFESGLWIIWQLVIELFVVVIEGVIYRSFKGDVFGIKRPFIMSLILNVASYGLGLLINLIV